MAGISSKVCAQCGAVFERRTRLSDMQWNGRRYCSKPCAGRRSSQQDADIVAMYQAEKSSTEIAEIAGVSAVQVIRILRKRGVKIRTFKEAITISHNRPEIKAKMAAARTGVPLSEEAKEKLRSIYGPDHPLWRGGVTQSAQGYPTFTASRANGENAGRSIHRVKVEEREGRKLDRNEHVHHRDENKRNYSDQNLVIMTPTEHARLHALKNKLGHHPRSGE